MANGICENANNRIECGFDGGDCIDVQGTQKLSNTKFLPYFFFAENCVVPDKFNDGFCDDLNNLALCGYDGDDCCNSQDSEFCEICMCYKSNFQISRFFGASKVHFFRVVVVFLFLWIQIPYFLW